MALMVFQLTTNCRLQHEEGSERARDPEMVKRFLTPRSNFSSYAN